MTYIDFAALARQQELIKTQRALVKSSSSSSPAARSGGLGAPVKARGQLPEIPPHPSGRGQDRYDSKTFEPSVSTTTGSTPVSISCRECGLSRVRVLIVVIIVLVIPPTTRHMLAGMRHGMAAVWLQFVAVPCTVPRCAELQQPIIAGIPFEQRTTSH